LGEIKHYGHSLGGPREKKNELLNEQQSVRGTHIYSNNRGRGGMEGKWKKTSLTVLSHRGHQKKEGVRMQKRRKVAYIGHNLGEKDRGKDANINPKGDLTSISYTVPEWEKEMWARRALGVCKRAMGGANQAG